MCAQLSRKSKSNDIGMLRPQTRVVSFSATRTPPASDTPLRCLGFLDKKVNSALHLLLRAHVTGSPFRTDHCLLGSPSQIAFRHTTAAGETSTHKDPANSARARARTRYSQHAAKRITRQHRSISLLARRLGVHLSVSVCSTFLARVSSQWGCPPRS